MSTTVTALTKAVTIHTLRQHQADNEKTACVALYDAAMATLAQDNGVELIIVGDSLGMTVQGHHSTLPVTIEHMVYHTAAVSRGNNHSMIIADLPFMSYSRPEQAMDNAALLMQAGAHRVKLEGGHYLAKTVKKLTQRGIPVCAHLGLTPQFINTFGGYRVQGREAEQAQQIIHDAKTLEDAGADLVVLECVPSSLSKAIIEQTNLFTIGIGAGPDTDSQVLVINDMIGTSPRPPKFS
ncbi:MAG: 3-methyl-2-oxobutanoate hydroxymethyltransferase, partial [Pseudomonadota bacterium]